MSLPWVSRERLEQAERLLSIAHAETLRERDIAEQRYDNLLRRYDDLLEKFTALRVQGAVPELKPVEYAVAQPVERDELRELIADRCGTDMRKRGMMLRQLAADRAAQVPDEQIRAAIEQGIQPDGVPA